MYIQANRQEINRSFGIAGFTIRTGLSPSWFEVVTTTDWRLLLRDSKPQRTANNFYSSRALGPLPAPGGEAVYLLPPQVLSRFAGQEKLYYTIAVFSDPDRRDPRVITQISEGMPYIRISKSFTGQTLRQMVGVPNSQGGLTGNNYNAVSQESLAWAGDDAIPGKMEPLSQMPTVAAPAAPPVTKPAATGAALTYAAPRPASSAHATAPAGYALAVDYDAAYDDGFGVWPAPPVAALSTDIPLDPGNGGQSIGLDALAIGDIILSTTDARISRWIRAATGSQVSHTMLYTGDGGQVVEAIGDGVTFRPLAEALAEATVAVAFRVPNLTDTQALIVRDFVGQQIGKSYNYWGIVRQAGFQLDRATWCRNKTGADYDSCVNWAGRINLGTADNESFFCSQLVLAAYQQAGVPLTSTPPNWGSPEDIAELRLSGRLGYVGHLKAPPLDTSSALDLRRQNGPTRPAAPSGDSYIRATRARALSGEQSFDLNWSDVELVPQLSSMSCWAASAAMVIGWRDRVSINPEEVARGGGYWQQYHDNGGLQLTSIAAFGRALGLQVEAPQCYSITGFRQMLETHGPLWVSAVTPGYHAIVVTGMYSDGNPDGSGTFVRILDPWGRGPGNPNAPGAYNPTPGQGSQYTLSWPDFTREYEDAATTAPDGTVNIQILHASDTDGRSPYATAQTYGRDLGARRPARAQGRTSTALAGPVVAEIATTIAGTVMTRLMDNAGDVSWEVDQLKGLKYPDGDPAKVGQGPFIDIVTRVDGPIVTTALDMDKIYADFEIRWQCNGHSLGNIQIVNVGTEDAVFAGLHVQANIMDDANTYVAPPDTDLMAGIRVHFYYRFTNTVYADTLAETDFVLYGDGKYKRTHHWLQ
jgi:uncharacterized protein YycO